MNPQVTQSSDTDTSPYLFNAQQLARLAVYRAAVVAHFYTDEVDRPKTRRLTASVRRLSTMRSESTVRSERRAA